MNRVIFSGRLAADPEVRYSQGANATAIANYTLAVDRPIKRDGEPTADFFNMVAFGKNAEFAEKYLSKGIKIMVECRARQDSYTNKDGQKVYGIKFDVDRQEFCESKGSTANAEKPTESPQRASGEGFMNIPDGVDEELPFN